MLLCMGAQPEESLAGYRNNFVHQSVPTFTLGLIVFKKYCAGLFDQGGSRYPKTFRPSVDRIQELGREQ